MEWLLKQIIVWLFIYPKVYSQSCPKPVTSDILNPTKIATGASVTFTCDFSDVPSDALKVSLGQIKLTNSSDSSSSESKTVISNCNTNEDARFSATQSCNVITKYFQWKLINATFSDAGCWQCKFVPNNQSGSFEKFSFLYVQVPPGKPFISSNTHTIENNQLLAKNGSEVTLTCLQSEVNAEPVDFSWRKDDGKPFSTSNMTTIVLSDATEGLYHCNASNSAGETMSDPVSLEIMYPPQTVTLASLPPSPVKNETTVEFTCTASKSNPKPDLYLYSGNTQIISFAKRSNVLKAKVVITSETKYFYFNCYANSTMTSDVKISNNINYEVYYLPKRLVLNSSSSFPVKVETEVTFSCIAYEYFPKPNLGLYFDGNILGPTHTEVQSFTFKHKMISYSNGEAISCRASSTYQVLAGEKVISNEMKADIQFMPSEVKLTSSRSEKFPILEGTLVALTCAATRSNPAPDFEIIRINDDLTLAKTAFAKVLIKRTFNASNIICRAFATGKTILGQKQDSNPISYIVYYLPDILNISSSHKIIMGKKITEKDETLISFKCTAALYYPTPRLSLVVDGVELVTKNYANSITYSLRTTRLNDGNNVMCKASLLDGDKQTTPITLDIQFKPVLLEETKSVFYFLDSDVEVKFMVAENPKSTVAYCENSKVKIPLKYEPLGARSKSQWMLFIPKASEEHSGTWTCKIANSIGGIEFKQKLVDSIPDGNEGGSRIDPVLIAVPIALVVIVVIVVAAIIIYCYRKNRMAQTHGERLRRYKMAVKEIELVGRLPSTSNGGHLNKTYTNQDDVQRYEDPFNDDIFT